MHSYMQEAKPNINENSFEKATWRWCPARSIRSKVLKTQVIETHVTCSPKKATMSLSTQLLIVVVRGKWVRTPK